MDGPEVGAGWRSGEEDCVQVGAGGFDRSCTSIRLASGSMRALLDGRLRQGKKNVHMNHMEPHCLSVR